ncbi:MAG: acyl-CoA dehydrogenase family protein [Nitriliruptorales bacterium]|nr:acyl-CoA dehydrogenase family protein [Nitriliruptorales bacterium]
MAETDAADQVTEAPTRQNEAEGRSVEVPEFDGASSFAKGLFLGRLDQDMVTPYPKMDDDERTKVRDLVDQFHGWASENYDQFAAEQAGWIGDGTIEALGEMGYTGLYVPEEYGGLGLSQSAYCRVFEEFGKVDAALAVSLGVHQSIGYKGIALFGTDEQKERYLPDLAAGRKLAAFALTEPETGSDAYNLETRVERQADGSWLLNGEKRWIGNGHREVLTVFAESEEHGHVALIVDGDLDGVDSPKRYDTLGLRANQLRHVRFNDVRVPPENVLGEPGDGFRVAMHILNNGRMSLGTGSVGAMKGVLDLAIDHTLQREQFGRPLAEFELVEEKVSWMTSYLYGLESMCYLATGLVDQGVKDYSLESAMLKVAGTEFLWYGVNRAFQLHGGEAYMAGTPLEKTLRDVRVFPIFEGANDVLRAYIALTGLKTLGNELEGLSDVLDVGALMRPVRSASVVLDYVAGRVKREVRPDELTHVHPELRELAEPVSDQVKRLREVSEKLLRRHGKDIVDRQWQQKRLAHAAMDIVGQVATLSRVTALMNDQGAEASGTEGYIADTFCTRAAARVERHLDQVEHNDDDRMHAIARVAYRNRGYTFELYD